MRHLPTAVSIATVLALSACNSGDAPAGETAEEAAAETTAEAESPPPAPAAEATTDAPAAAAPAEIEGIENRRVTFAPGANSATVEGSITGYEGVDYLLNVREGQAMNVSMATQNTSAYFNILEPGETEVATFIGSTSGNQFEGVAAKSGDYRIRVYMMRSAARRDETADYRLEMIVD
jgi:hypothetical protein